MSAITEWSVRVQLSPEETRAMDFHRLRSVFPREVHRWSHAFADRHEFEGPSNLTIELEAQSANAARVVVQHALGKVRESAQMPVIESQIVWVAPLDSGPESSHRFLEHAHDLFDSEVYDLAVVAAQIHVELHVSTLLRMLVGGDESKVAHGLLASRIEWTQTQAWQRDLFESLIGRRLSKDFPDWKQYAVHVERRNAIVHRGQAVDRKSAEDSLQVTSSFWTWLNDAALQAMA